MKALRLQEARAIFSAIIDLATIWMSGTQDTVGDVYSLRGTNDLNVATQESSISASSISASSTNDARKRRRQEGDEAEALSRYVRRETIEIAFRQYVRRVWKVASHRL